MTENDEETEEREYSELTEKIYSVFNKFTEELGFISKVQIEQAEEADQLYWKENEDGEAVAAAIIRHCQNKPQTTLQDLAVAEDYRGQGLAKEILEEAQDDSPHPYMIAKCPQDLPSNHFYRENGWILQRVQEGKNRDLLVWRKELIESQSVFDW